MVGAAFIALCTAVGSAPIPTIPSSSAWGCALIVGMKTPSEGGNDLNLHAPALRNPALAFLG